MSLLLVCLVAVLSLLFCGRAFAGCSYGGGQSFTLTLPTTVSVPRDAPVGSLLTTWVASPASSNLWTCSSSGGLLGAGVQVGPIVGASTGQTYNSGGTFTVYKTNLPGVGIVLAGRSYTPNAGWYGWFSVYGGMAYSGVYATWAMGAQVQVALIKTGTISAGGTVSGGVVAQAFPNSDGPRYDLIASYVITPVNVVPLTCTTPDVSIPMGTFKTTDFPSVGSLSPNPAGFAIQLLNCPGGTAVSGTQAGQIHSIQYRIDPTSGTLATNVAALTGSPSASGVGIELFNSSGAVFPLSTNTTLSGYNSASGGSYSIPMTTRYYRTGTITAGPANSTMTLTVSYQ
ncbi:fimbrial protein [Paraburkholderia bannensis]|uniref:fimbrial protein n=1 Tax=Paraburkholderia bannensis TaxID=765414 RepID=UPI002ABE7D1B|nr:fimbrial protein [Paraburkholderia bannensis]